MLNEKAIPSPGSIALHAMDQRDIHHAIDLGGGQACDIPGVIRALDEAGFVIVRKGLHQSLRRMVEVFEPFTALPMGAPGSIAREAQDEQIAAHAEALALAYPKGHLRDV